MAIFNFYFIFGETLGWQNLRLTLTAVRPILVAVAAPLAVLR